MFIAAYFLCVITYILTPPSVITNEYLIGMLASKLYMSEDSKNTSLIPSDREPYTSRTLTFKLTNSEYKAIKEQAIKYANGNVSAWIRYAAIHMVPLGEHINKATSEQLGELSLGDINSADSNI